VTEWIFIDRTIGRCVVEPKILNQMLTKDIDQKIKHINIFF